MPFLLLLQVHLLSSTFLLPFLVLVQVSLVLPMCHAQSIPIPVVRQQAVWDVRAMCRVSLCCCSSSSVLFTGFLLLWGGVVRRPQPHGSKRTERGNSLPWHGSATMGPNTFGSIPALALCTSFQCVSGVVPSTDVSSDASPLLLLICLPSVWEPSGTGYDWVRAIHRLLPHWSPLQLSDTKTLQCTLSMHSSVA